MVTHRDKQVTRDAVTVGLAVAALRRARWLDILGERILDGTEPALQAGEVDTLDAVAANRGAQMSDIADALEVTRSTATRAVDRLVNLRLVERYQDPADGRNVRVQLTEKGVAVHAELKERRIAFTVRVFEQLTPEDQQTAKRLVPLIAELIINEIASIRQQTDSISSPQSAPETTHLTAT